MKELIPLRNLNTMQRFLRKTRVMPNGCVEWQSREIGTKYGHMSINGVRYLSHRLSYAWANSKEPHSLFVCHSCDNPKCVNPDHLWLGNVHDNNIDAINKNRSKIFKGHRMNTGIRNGRARLTQDDVKAIREALARGERQQVIADRYGVHDSHITNINKGRAWKHEQA
jgi:hypothetical protein